MCSSFLHFILEESFHKVVDSSSIDRLCDFLLVVQLLISHSCKATSFFQGFWFEHSYTINYFWFETAHECP
jgi:hypothetical protein